MTDYTKKTFTVAVGQSQEYRDNWDKVFGKKDESVTAQPERTDLDVYKEALHRISLASQNSMSTKEECGRIAREALAAALRHEKNDK